MTISPERTSLCRRSFIPLVCALILGPATSGAQLSTTRGVSLGVHVLGTSLTAEGSDARSGGGLGIHAGYGFNRIVTGFVNVDGSQVEIEASKVNGTWALSHAEVGARFHFANSLRRWVPYVEGSVGYVRDVHEVERLAAVARNRRRLAGEHAAVFVEAI